MPGADGTEPIDDAEFLYRRVPDSQRWYDPKTHPQLSPEAFRPQRHDLTGISLYRDRYKAIEDAAKGREGKRYYVAVLRAGDLRAGGIEVVPRPCENDPGHVEIPGLNYEARKTQQVREWKVRLAHNLTLEVRGPFPPSECLACN